jgi:hypothetical protein
MKRYAYVPAAYNQWHVYILKERVCDVARIGRGWYVFLNGDYRRRPFEKIEEFLENLAAQMYHHFT